MLTIISALAVVGGHSGLNTPTRQRTKMKPTTFLFTVVAVLLGQDSGLVSAVCDKIRGTGGCTRELPLICGGTGTATLTCCSNLDCT
ncbi:hypothetical protein CMUS01_00640 [Colletotrichum musicola]|uniref:Uncharacterized protein n=1 Tax=Colletotrichum musicola TaxID=2175873 RepID=A0A8H6U8S7_9PEZI|nr:hypothetical protein CMUS01_00640 [Colletotrichum musicola]